MFVGYLIYLPFITCVLFWVWACIEQRRRICREESDGDGGAGEKKEMKTKAEVVG